MHGIQPPSSIPSVLLALVFAISAVPESAVAASQRTFVASSGVDAGNLTCSLASPCRSFNVAIGNTNAGGEVVILDTAGYGSMVINKSITVIGPSGIYGGISVGAPGTDGVTINAGNGDTVKLRGLDITGLGGLNGINVVNAAGVHIEKTSISNFGADNGACVNVTSGANAVRVYVVDSFLRQCRVGVAANGTALSANRSSVTIDNTRLERGLNTGASSLNYGVVVQGFMDALIRNSAMSRFSAAVRFVDPLAGGVSHVTISGSEITRSNAAVQVSNTIATGVSQISITNSQILDNADGISVSNSAVGGNVSMFIADTQIAYSAGNGITLANSAADANTRVWLELDRSQVTNVATAIDLSANNGSKTYLVAKDAHLAHATTALKTSGGVSSDVSASLVRTAINNATTAVDHGLGVVRLDGTHVVRCTDDFVNNGSGNIVSLNNNLVHDNPNSSAVTHITPAIIPTK